MLIFQESEETWQEEKDMYLRVLTRTEGLTGNEGWSFKSNCECIWLQHGEAACLGGNISTERGWNKPGQRSLYPKVALKVNTSKAFSICHIQGMDAVDRFRLQHVERKNKVLEMPCA